jgi:PAS domain S-box-containing protein
MTLPESEVESALEPAARLRSAAEIGRAHRARRARWDAIATRLPLMFYTYVSSTEREFQFTYVSPYSAVLTGFTPEEICAQPELLLERFHPEDVPDWRAKLEEAKREQRDWFHELRYRHKAGHYIWIRSQAWREYRPDGSFRSVGYWIDISADRMAEDKLRASEQRYRDLVEGSLQGMFIHRDFRLLFANPAMAEMMGYDSVESFLAAGDLLEMVAPLERARARCYYELRMSGGNAPERFEIGYSRRDGAEIVLEMQSRVINWNGQPAVQSTAFDITERKRAEQALRDSERRYRDLIENSVLGILIQHDLKPLFVNRAYVQMFGYGSVQELLALESVEALVHPDDRERLRGYQTARRRGAPVPEQYEFRGLRKDGSVIWVSSHVRQVHWQGLRAHEAVCLDITRQKSAEQALQNSEQRFRDLVEGSLQGIFIRDEKRIVFANQAMADILGFPSVQALVEFGDPLGFYPPHELPRLRRYAELRLRSEPAPPDYECEAQRWDGRMIWVEVRARPVEWEGRPGIQVIIYDITERKRAERALRESETRFRTLVEGSVQGILVHRDFKPLFVNQAFADIFGFPSREATLALPDITGTFEPADLEWTRQRNRDQLAGRRVPLVVERRVIRADGSVGWVEALPTVVEWEGEPAFLVSYVDITERKRAEEALHQSRAYLAAVLDTAADGIVTIDREGIVESFNLAAGMIFGYDRAEVIGRNISMLVPTPHRERHQEYIESYLRTGQSRIIGIGRDTLGQRKDGSIFPISIDVSEVRQGERITFTAIIKDITEKKLHEQALQETAQAKTVMLSNLSHELRTPLTSVLGFAQILRREKNLTEPQRVDLGIIEESARHLLELVDDVLEVQKMEAGFLKLVREDFDLHHAVSSLIEMFRPRSEGKQVELLLDIAANVPRYVNGDPRKLRQVLINLIGNSIKFTDQGRIAVELSPENEGVRFKVRDTGPGISPWDLEEIMKPFRQFSTARGGTGLGLSISKGLVELMGGRLEVDSTVGIGSEFSFALPFGEAGAALDFDRVREGVQPGVDLHGGARVLIVDDDGALREWLRRTLRSEGYETQEAEDGRAALRRYSEFRPQLILMDMRMPVMGGMEAIRQIRRMEGGADIPILALTADPASVKPAPGEPEAPYQRALTKPLESGRLLEALRELLPARPPQGNAGGLGLREGGLRAPET